MDTQDVRSYDQELSRLAIFKGAGEVRRKGAKVVENI
jgi:hypothetical protein